MTASVRCPAGHSFDVARQGYLSLLPGDARLGSADTAAMVAARERFLGAGHFDPLAEALTAEASRRSRPGRTALWSTSVPGRAGTWRELSIAPLAAPGWRSTCPSTHFAARRAPTSASAPWPPTPGGGCPSAMRGSRWPSACSRLATVPSWPGCCSRAGRLIVVTPSDRHLVELIEVLGLLNVDEQKRARLAAQLDPHLCSARESELEWTLELGPAEVRDMVTMGPSARHADPARLERGIAALPEPVAVTASVEISAWLPSAGAPV